MSFASQGRLIGGDYREPEPLTLTSFGAGQDSTALIMKMLFDEEFRGRWAPGRLLVCFADTGDEHDATYEHLQSMKDVNSQPASEFLTENRSQFGVVSAKMVAIVGSHCSSEILIVN